MPKSPERLDLHSIDHGVMFEGTKGVLVSPFTTRVIIPIGNDADMTYYKPRPKEKLIPPMGDFLGEWINACKGSLKTSCNFDYGGKMIETMLLGLAAYRANKKLDYDAATAMASSSSEPNPALKRTYRDGWSLNG